MRFRGDDRLLSFRFFFISKQIGRYRPPSGSDQFESSHWIELSALRGINAGTAEHSNRLPLSSPYKNLESGSIMPQFVETISLETVHREVINARDTHRRVRKIRSP